ncbi:MAG: class I SAM-dependent methyltransferase [Acidobacteria bacterium]|nr:class I SAM-dependent methyltransferase [Acidobacteriota bacterium]
MSEPSSTRNKKKLTRGSGVFESFLARQRSQKANRLIPNSLRSGKILDIGCGTYPYFLEKTRFNKKYGMDKSDEVTRYIHFPQLTTNNTPVDLQQWDFENQTNLPFESEFFNVVTMLAVIEHIEPANTRKLIFEIYRVLQKNGLLILTTPTAWTDSLLRGMARLKLVSPVEIADHKDTFTHKKLFLKCS